MSQRVKAGGIAAFVCIATGDPTPHISWRKDKKAIPDRYIPFFPRKIYLRMEQDLSWKVFYNISTAVKKIL